jgi:hypothetical protein
MQNKIENHIYEAENLVIGSGLNAAAFSYLNGYPLIINKQELPFRFDYFDTDFDLSSLNIINDKTILKGKENEKVFGNYKTEVYRHLIFVLALAGLCPLSDKVGSIRLKDDSLLNIVTDSSRMIKIKFDQLFVFDDKNITGLPEPLESLNEKMFKVLDWIDVTCCTTHPYQYFETDDNFTREMFFYPTERMDGYQPDKKDLVSVSYLSESQLHDYEYSDTYAKFKILNIMKEAGIRGRRNGRDQKNKEKYKYYALKIEPQKREVIPLQKNLYEDTDNIEFMYESEEDIIQSFPIEKEHHVHSLNSKINDYTTK